MLHFSQLFKDFFPTFNFIILNVYCCILLVKMNTDEKWVRLSTTKLKYIIHDNATINSHFICLPFLSNMLPLHFCIALLICLWGISVNIGKNGNLHAVVLAKSLESRYLHRMQFFIKKADSTTSATCSVTFVWFGGIVRWRSSGLHEDKKETTDEIIAVVAMTLVLLIGYDSHRCVIWRFLCVPPWYKNQPMSHHI